MLRVEGIRRLTSNKELTEKVTGQDQLEKERHQIAKLTCKLISVTKRTLCFKSVSFSRTIEDMNRQFIV